MDTPHRLLQRAKWILAHALRLTGVLAAIRRRRARRGEIPVLWLHRVDGTPEARVPMGVPPAVFRELVSRLQRHYRIAPWADCVAAAAARAEPLHLAITFDDGYRDNAEIAWPILRETGATGVFCLTTRFVDGAEPLWWERVAEDEETPRDGTGRDERSVPGSDPDEEASAPTRTYPVKSNGEATWGHRADARIDALKSLPDRDRRAAVSATRSLPSPEPLSWEAACRMRAEGAELAGHTRTHPILPACEEATLEQEVTGCRDDLRGRTGEDVALFAYPNGSHDARVVEAVRRAGYRYAFTIEKGYYTPETDPLRIPRIGVSEPRYSLDGQGFSWTLFEAEMLGVFDTLLGRRRRHGGAATTTGKETR